MATGDWSCYDDPDWRPGKTMLLAPGDVMFVDDPRSMIYRHVMTGGLYVVLHWEAMIESSMDKDVIYQSLSSCTIWVRPKSEFMDGRFECVPRDQIDKVGS